MITHAALIAEKLQGAHERRIGKRREDEDMSKDKDEATPAGTMMATGAGIWDDEPGSLAHMIVNEDTNPELRVIRELGERFAALRAELAELEAQLEAERGMRDDQRVADLEQQLEQMSEQAGLIASERDRAHEHLAEALVRAEQAEQDMEAANAAANERDGEHAELIEARDLLATAYVPREVPWSDVAAGMMTISAQGEAFLVTEQSGDVGMGNGTWALTGLYEGKVIRFEKTPAAGETVRVLVPYVTPAQAEATLRAAGGVPLDQDPVYGEVS